MTSIKAYGTWCVLMVALALSWPAQATTIVMPSDDQLIEKSPVIVRGTVVRSDPVEYRGGIWTETVVEVEESVKGDVSGEIVIREVGGQIGDRLSVVFGAPEYEAGEEVLAFLLLSPRGDYQTVDLFAGKFDEKWTIDGQRLWFRSAELPNTRLLDQSYEPIVEEDVQREADGFGQYVRERVAGREGDPNYGVRNPRLVEAFQSNFELIGEPTVYRWFEFDGGGSVQWMGHGAQPGYSGGGITEAKTAISSWSGYSAARIGYVWGGISSGSPGGLDQGNGINEVIFNDPLGEIAGSWDGKSGVVGRGGFNRVRGSKSWTSPFAADGIHTARTYTAWDIIEGDLVIQDGVSPALGISSHRFAEILSHEFGHTLGFGHSADKSALMYASVSGLGPSLREDDQVAARWLYPASSGGGNLEIPAAPSSLAAKTLSETTARLTWNDNSGVETSQTVYISAGGGYSKLQTVGANIESLDVGGLQSGATYSLRVTASNSAGESSVSNTASVTMPSSAVSAAFVFSPSTGAAGTTNFAFSDRSTGPVTSWQWNFGDGTSSTSRNPSHVYQSSGTFQVTLTVRGSSGQQSSASRQVAVGSPATPAVVASFDLSSNSVSEKEQVSFYDRSSGSPTWWQWSFGDGGTSSSRNPAHSYTRAGTYQVTLKAGNAGGSSSASRTVSVGSASVRFNSLVPVSTTSAGVGGTYWRTDLTIFNASSFPVSVDVVYLPGAGEASRTSSVSIGAGRSASWQNVLAEMFGLSKGAGALHFETSSSSGTPDLRISSRTYTNSPNGTYGQFVGDLRGEAIAKRLYLAGLSSNNARRSNIGVVNRSASSVSSTLSLYASNGSLLGRTTIALPANSFRQQSLTALFPNVGAASYDQMSMEIESPVANAVTAYASIIDNVSQDPVFVPASAAETDRDVFIAAVGRTGGSSGTYWRSDVTLFNPSNATVSATVRFLRAGEDNRFAGSRTLTIGPRSTRTISDVLSWLSAGQGTGALQISWSGQSQGVVTTSRTYTTRGFDAGTLGQAIGMAGSGSFGRDAILTGLRSDSGFRTNVGLVNSGDSAIGVTLRLIAPDGRQLGSTSVTVAPKSQMQSSAAALFSGVPFATLGSFSVRAETSSPTMFAYGSVIDNQSGDPIFVSGR